jgi:hypothetical protein
MLLLPLVYRLTQQLMLIARALVTAALLTLDPATIGMLTAANMLAPDCRCKTLDAAADGRVRQFASSSSTDLAPVTRH